mgnify:CR=1 FL=1
MEASNGSHENKRNKKRFEKCAGDETCEEAIDIQEEVKLEDDIDRINKFSELIKLQKEYDLDGYCKNIKELISHWHMAELAVQKARAVLFAIKDRSSYLDVPFKEFKKAAKKIRRNPTKAAGGIVKSTEKALKKGRKEISTEFKRRFETPKFKQDYSQCADIWCKSEGLYYEESVSCNTILLDLQKPNSSVGYPQGLDELPLEDLGYKEGLTAKDFSKVKKIKLLEEIMNQRTSKCFQNSFKLNHTDVLNSKIGCFGDEYKKVSNFNDLAGCSYDYMKMNEIYEDVKRDAKKVEGMKVGLKKGDLRSKAYASKLLALQREMRDFKKIAEKIDSDRDRKIFDDYEHKEIVKEYCGEF